VTKEVGREEGGDVNEVGKRRMEDGDRRRERNGSRVWSLGEEMTPPSIVADASQWCKSGWQKKNESGENVLKSRCRAGTMSWWGNKRAT